MENMVQFLKDLLTDRIDNIKERALDLYVELKTAPVSNCLILSFPFVSSYKLHIKLADYEEVKRLYLDGQKIAAIKHLRMTSLLNGDKALGGPDLKEAKDFVEGHIFN